MSELAKDLGKFLKESDDLAHEVVRLKAEVQRLEDALRSSREWNDRLNEKVTTLELGVPEGPDAWDERFMFDKQVTIRFRKRTRGDMDSCHKIVIAPRSGRKTILFGGRSEPLLRKAIEVMNGRKRASAKQQEAPGVSG